MQVRLTSAISSRIRRKVAAKVRTMTHQWQLKHAISGSRPRDSHHLAHKQMSTRIINSKCMYKLKDKATKPARVLKVAKESNVKETHTSKSRAIGPS